MYGEDFIWKLYKKYTISQWPQRGFFRCGTIVALIPNPSEWCLYQKSRYTNRNIWSDKYMHSFSDPVLMWWFLEKVIFSDEFYFTVSGIKKIRKTSSLTDFHLHRYAFHTVLTEWFHRRAYWVLIWVYFQIFSLKCSEILTWAHIERG